MSENVIIPKDNLVEHPAIKGWKTLQPNRIVPASIEILKKKRRSPVYKLEGIGPQGADVVAKRSILASALVEHTIYENILPHLPIPTLSYYGFFKEENSEYGWNFLAYTNADKYSPRIEEHRVLAARWLALLHTSALRFAGENRLPDRGPRYYLGRLRSAQAKILNSLDNSALTKADLAVLKNIVVQCEIIASQWRTIEKLCQLIPHTLIHGDFATKNIHVQVGHASLVLQPFDWGSAGWGSIAIDLAQAGMLPNDYWASPDLATYYSVVREYWPHLKLEDLQMIAISGKIFRCLSCIDGDAENLAYLWVDKCMSKMQMYTNDMAEAIQAAKGVK